MLCSIKETIQRRLLISATLSWTCEFAFQVQWKGGYKLKQCLWEQTAHGSRYNLYGCKHTLHRTNHWKAMKANSPKFVLYENVAIAAILINETCSISHFPPATHLQGKTISGQCGFVSKLGKRRQTPPVTFHQHNIQYLLINHSCPMILLFPLLDLRGKDLLALSVPCFPRALIDQAAVMKTEKG